MWDYMLVFELFFTQKSYLQPLNFGGFSLHPSTMTLLNIVGDLTKMKDFE